MTGATIATVVEARYLLDANFCIDLLVGRSERGAVRVQQCSEGELVTSAVVYAEVMMGAGQRQQLGAANAFFRQVPGLPFDAEAGGFYARLPFKRGNFNRLIAAHALSLGLTLVTNNERDFADIPGLKVENWTR